MASDSWLAPVFSGLSWEDPITLLPSFGLFLLGLAFGALLWRRSGRAEAIESGSDPEMAEKGEDSESVAQDASSLGRAKEEKESARSRALLESELISIRQHRESQDEEIRHWGEHFNRLSQDSNERQRRIEALSQSLNHPAGLPRHRVVLAQARLPVAWLGECLRGELKRGETHQASLERLEKRLREGDRQIHAAGEELARLRSEVAGRLPDDGAEPAWTALADGLSLVEGQILEMVQKLSGYINRMGEELERLRSNQSHLTEAAQPILEAESRLSAESGDAVATDAALATARDELERARGRMAHLGESVEAEISEILDGVGRVVSESSAGLTHALDQFNAGESESHPEISKIESRIWREMGELRGTLSGLRLTLDSAAIAASAQGWAKSRLLAEADRTLGAVVAAQGLPLVDEPAPTSGTAENAGDALRAAEEEIERLRGDVWDREAEVGRLFEIIADLEKHGSRPFPLAAAADGTPEPVVTEGAGRDPDEGAEPSGSRQFIRRLLGLGPGRWEADLGASGVPSALVAPLAVPTLAEARAVVTELRQVPVPVREATDGQSNGGHHDFAGSPKTLRDSGESHEEIARLKSELAARDARLAVLEAELEALQEPVPPPRGEPALESTGSLFSFSAEPAAHSGYGGGPEAILPGEPFSRAPGEVVVFRGRDPGLWNTRSEARESAYAIPLEEIPEDTGYVRLTRLDTGESVVAPVTKAELLSGGGFNAERGWSSRGEPYFGAFHLGLFDETLPKEVETKFGSGGWGFGHRESIGAGQAFAWAGKAIEDPGEGFEISVGTGEVPAEATKAEFPDPTPAPGSDELAAQSDNRITGLVLFRSNDPTLWGTEVYTGANRRSRALASLPGGLAFLRLRRVDTGEGIVAPVTNSQLLDDGDGRPRGFNGANEFFYGAYHLGLFDESLPQEFETRFTFGGWGFGHTVAGTECQASGWEGLPIPSHTIFEIAVFRRMPVLGENDRLLER